MLLRNRATKKKRKKYIIYYAQIERYNTKLTAYVCAQKKICNN